MTAFVEKLKKILRRVATPNTRRNRHRPDTNLDSLIGDVRRNPQDPALHSLVADEYAKQQCWQPAIAEYRTSLALGNTDQNMLEALAKAYEAIGQPQYAISVYKNLLADVKESHLIPKLKTYIAQAKQVRHQPLSTLNHNRYYRLNTLAKHMLTVFSERNFSVLDVGGGTGELALFFPEAHYVLAEPSVNGLAADNLQFAEKTFDVVVASHVFEHIPAHERESFLNQLLKKTKKYLLLLNPFACPGDSYRERLELVFELTGAQWAKEHLDCELPEIDVVKNFARAQGLGCKIIPTGTLTTSLAMVFLDHYAAMAGKDKEVKKINQLYNTAFFDNLTNAEFPTGYLVELQRAPTFK